MPSPTEDLRIDRALQRNEDGSPVRPSAARHPSEVELVEEDESVQEEAGQAVAAVREEEVEELSASVPRLSFRDQKNH